MSRRLSNARGVRSNKNQQKHLRTTRSLRAELLEPRAMMSASSSLWTLGAIPGGYGQTVVTQTTTLGDNADTTVQNGGSAYRNYGRNNTLVVAKNGANNNESQAALRFNMNSISSTVSSAILQLTRLQSNSNNQNVTLRIRLAADGSDYWTEGTNGTNYGRGGAMTWNNRVQGTGLTVTIAASQWSASNTFSIDVTSLVKQTYNANRIATFVLDVVPSGRSNSSITFASREYGAAGYRPSLAVTTTTIINDPPVVTTAAAASSGTVTGTSTVLSVLGDDDLGESNLRYTWTATTLPNGAAAPTFSANGSNAAKTTTASFSKAGTYVLTATISDASGAFVTSSIMVMVDQTFTSVLVTPGSATLYLGTQKQFAASARDQFGNAMATSPAFDWSASGGSITSDGLLTAPATAGSVTVTASTGSIQGTASVTVTASKFLDLNDADLAFLTQSLYADGSISRLDMIQILRSVGSDDSVVDAAELADLKTILSKSATLGIASYVQVLAGDVVNGSVANAYFQGTTLGNLSAGSSATKLNHLVDKWFLGADHPTDAGLNYVSACGTLFVNGPSHYDMRQGQLGDCYFIASLGSIADNSAAAIQNMFVDNGDNTWTVRFYVNGTADYVTVDRMLPVTSSGRFIFANYGYVATSASNELWIALAEKAYAQWNETGKEGRDGKNLYHSIEGGWMATVYSQVLGKSASSYSTSSNANSTVLANAMKNRWAVTVGTKSTGALSYGLYGNHAYDVVAYNSSTGKYTLYNPWGSNQPTQSLTWTQLRSVCDFFAVANPAGTTAISLARATRAGIPSNPAWAVDQLYMDRGATPAVGPGAGHAVWASGGFHGYQNGATDDEDSLAVNMLLQHVS